MALSLFAALAALLLLHASGKGVDKHRLPEAVIVVTMKRLALFVGSFVVWQSLILATRLLLAGSGYWSAWLRRVSMLVGLEYAMCVCSALIWNRLVDLVPKAQPHDASYRWRRDLIKSLAVVWLALAHLCLGLYYVLVTEEPHWLAVACFAACALYIHVTALMLAASLAEVVLKAVAARFHWSTDITLTSSWFHKLIWCSRLHTVLCILMSVLMVSVGFYTTSLPPIIREVPVRVRRLPAHLSGTRIALITDVHIGPTVGRRRMEIVVDTVNQARADMVAIVGDLTDGDVSALWRAAEPLGRLQAAKGVFYVTGNHEYYHGRVDAWLAYLKRNLTVVPLRNEARRLGVNAGNKRALCLAGVDDISAGHTSVTGHAMNASSALAGCRPGDAVVLLAHQPTAAKEMLKDSRMAERIDLILAGHTHAGQMYVIAPLSYMMNPFYYGLYSTPSGAQVYVSAGVNYWGPPVKMWRLTEVPVLTLNAAV